MSAFLVAYLDAIDEELLAYLDDEEELRLDTVQRMRFYVSALLEGSINPVALAEDWLDFFHLSSAFVATYAPDLAEAEMATSFFVGADDIGGETPLTGPDRVYLSALEERLDTYPEMRMTGEQ